jgi:hypothetical protein
VHDIADLMNFFVNALERGHLHDLVDRLQGYTYHASPGLLVGVGADGRIAFASVDDIRDLRNTLAAIQAHQITLAAR